MKHEKGTALAMRPLPLIISNFLLCTNESDRDLETDRDMERFVEPHTPALSRLSLHTADRRAPKFNMAPTNRAKSDREEAIQRDLEKREQENTPFDELTGIWHSKGYAIQSLLWNEISSKSS